MKNYILTAIVALLIGGAFGYYLMPSKIVTETKVVTVEKEVQVDTHKTTVTVEKSDGTKTTTTVDNSVVNTTQDTQSTDNKTVKTNISKNVLNLSALAGYSFSTLSPVYGLEVSKNLLGPITSGLWAMTNRSCGLSIGLNF